MQDSHAHSLFTQGKWEEAAEAYGNLLSTLSLPDPMALSLAPLYFRYGVALYHIGRAEIFSNATNAASKDLASAVQFEVGKHIELPSDSEESDGEECADSTIDPKNDVNSNAEVNTCVEVDSKCEVD